MKAHQAENYKQWEGFKTQMEFSSRGGGRTLEAKKNSVTRRWKVGKDKVQFDWKLGEQREGKRERNTALLGKASKAR